jgi:photosystem II stability/assembly factor-like uncharacterized protein
MKTLNLLNNKVLVFIFILTSFHCKAQWNAVYEPDSTVFLGMHFTSDSVGYVVGYKLNALSHSIGQIFKTTDGGNHWVKILEGTTQTSNPASYLRFASVYFPTSNIGYVGANFNIILKTTDAGQTWITQTVPEFYFDTRMIYCIDSLTCFAGKAYMFKTFDGGLNWLVDSNASPLDDVSFPSPNKGFGIWSNTNDGGQNWSTFQFPNGLAATYRCIDFFNESLGWAGGSGQDGSPNFNFGTIAKTSDGGISWQQKDFQYEMLDIRDIVFINDSVGWACGAGQSGNSRQILKTIDGGLNWHKQFLNYTTNYSAVTQMQCLNDTLCYAISGWQIFKTINGGGPMIGLGISEHDNLNQISVYPNPSKEFIKIQNQEINSAITIYNITGAIVFQSVLNQSKEIYIKTLKNGLYFINCTNSKGSQTVKFIKE